MERGVLLHMQAHGARHGKPALVHRRVLHVAELVARALHADAHMLKRAERAVVNEALCLRHNGVELGDHTLQALQVLRRLEDERRERAAALLVGAQGHHAPHATGKRRSLLLGGLRHAVAGEADLLAPELVV